MTSFDMPLGLPDPATKPAFYDGVLMKRALAWLFDVVIIAILCLLILPFTAFTAIFFFPFLMMVIGFFYRWTTLTSRSATWGMRLFGVQIRNNDGNVLDSGTAFAHTLGYSVSVAMAPLQLISVAMMVLTDRKQGLTDHLLGTAAINRPAW